MKDFLIAEYKTILVTLLVLGGVFTWFYVQELEKDAQKVAETAHTYVCLFPGEGTADFKMGQALPALDATWTQKRDEVTGLISWTNADKTVSLNVRENVIQTIEIYPKPEKMDACRLDFEAWSKANKQIAQTIKHDNREFLTHRGVVHVREVASDDNADPETIGWWITANME